jgi:hypothetical protein
MAYNLNVPFGQSSLKKGLKNLWASVWLYPAILVVGFVGLVSFGISGTSVGMYHKALFGDTVKDKDLLYGTPRAIRSDEWVGGTVETIGQYRLDYPKFNKNISTGREVALQVDVPYKDWSVAFKPHHWGFLILPLENAFAFRWWMPMLTLLLGSYFFALRVLGRHRLLSAGISAAIALSPFFLWWYQTAAIGTVAYAFLSILIAIRIIDGENLRLGRRKFNLRISNIIYVILLMFVLACFSPLFYPPFQIPVAIVAAFYILGYTLNKHAYQPISYILKKLGLLGVSALLAVCVGILFVITNHEALTALGNTIYPGSRTIESGHNNPLFVFDAFVNPLLQSDFRGGHFFTNQSEASNFILLLPFLILPSIALMVYEYRKYKRVDWVFLLIQLCGLLFLVRFFIPLGSNLFKLLLLDRVPGQRLLIGMGFVGFLQLIYIIKKLSELKIRAPLIHWRYSVLLALYGALCLAVLFYFGAFILQHYPLFTTSRRLIIGLALAFVSIIVALLANKPRLAVILLLIFSIGSSFRIMPLYRGLGVIEDNRFIQAIDKISRPTDTWATVDSSIYQGLLQVSGRQNITGTQIYPDLEFWDKVAGRQYRYIYNREGRAVFSTDPALKETIQLTANNEFAIKFGCSKFLLDNVDFVLSPHTLNYYCLNFVETVSYPKQSIYLYKVAP